MKEKKSYTALARKYGLPSFEQLDRNFDLAEVEEAPALLQEIRRRIDEKVDTVRGLLEEVLHPDTTLAGIYESAVFSEPEKREVFETYRKLMKMHRQAFELLVASDEEADAAFIRKSSERWNQLKGELQRITRKLQESWEKNRVDDEKIGYMG